MRLFAFEEGWARAVLAAMFPVPVADGGEREATYGPGFSGIIASAPFEPAVGLRLALFMVILSPLFVLKRPRTFLGLTADAREQVLDGLLSSRVYAVRQLVLALKTMGALLYAHDPAVRRAMLVPKRDALITLGKHDSGTRAKGEKKSDKESSHAA
jgi:hypothetical protein